MKHIPLYTLLSTLYTLHLSAAVPLSWTVETSRAQPATFEAYQGETLTFEAHLQANGKPLEAPLNYSFFWQTNGMGSTYWEAPCAVPPPLSYPPAEPPEGAARRGAAGAGTNVLFATWSPSMDVGARVYNCFIGSPSNIYHAAFQLRLRPSPGATPNALPLPTPVIDFAKVTVLNPPWGSGGGVDTNAVRDIVRETISGDARPLPKYLHSLDFADSYTNEATAYYRSRGDGKTDGGCSARRMGNILERNFDFPFDDRAEFVVRMAAGPDRFASVGVAQVGTNLTEQMVTSGKPSRWYKCLPGATVDGINEHGVVAEINVVDGDPQTSGWHTTGDLHPLAAVRWALDHATNAQHAADYLASHISFPSGWTQNFHYVVADEQETYIVENGNYYRAGLCDLVKPVLTNFRVVGAQEGSGIERYNILLGGGNITNAWYTRAYRRSTTPPWVSDLAEVIAYTNEIFDAWASHPREYFRGKTNNGEPWWQTVHTSVYDIPNRVLRICVQENPDWYTFQVPVTGGSGGGGGVTAETDPTVGLTNGTLYVKGATLNPRDYDDRTWTNGVARSWIDPPAWLDVAKFTVVETSDGPDPDGNVWRWEYRPVSSDDDIVRGFRTSSGFNWPSQEAASNAAEVIVMDLDSGDRETVRRGIVPDSIALKSEIPAPQAETDPTVPPWAKQPAPPVTPSEGTAGNAAIADYASNAGYAEESQHAFSSEVAGEANHAQYSGFASDVEPNAPGLQPIAADAAEAKTRANDANVWAAATYNFMVGGRTNCWFSGTNYVFCADAATRHRFAWEDGMDALTVPCSMALWEIRDGARECVWDQRDWVSWYWSFKAAQIETTIQGRIDALGNSVTNDANYAWAKRYASDGTPNPDSSTTFIDTPSVTLSPGMRWETVATVSGAAYWTIVGNGAVIGGSGTNAVLSIRDFEGNDIMTVTKGEHRLAWLEHGEIYAGGMLDEDGWVCFDMLADVQPVGYFSTTPVDADFISENDTDCPAQRRWEDLGSGKWRVHFLLKPGIQSSACFAEFQVEIEGKTIIRYNVGQEISGGLIYNGVKIAPDISGSPAVGTVIQWKVVR